jgi:hypothetical protein
MKATMLYLLERITRAKIALEGLEIPHKNACPYDDDTGWPASCICGAETHNAKVRQARRELEIAPDKIRME